MSGDAWTVAVGSETTSAAYEPGNGGGGGNGGDVAVFVCAHGAGGNFADPGVLSVAAAMRASGIGVVRFNFLYREHRRGRPDPMPMLMETTASVVEQVRSRLSPGRLLIGGRSMGGRAASMLAADGFDADGLLLLAYPLHPPDKPEKLRDAHLPRIAMPVLCFNGTRDPFCTPALMEGAVSQVTTAWDMRWVEGADHSFHVLKSSGRTDAEVMAEIGKASRAWVDGLKETAGY